MTPDDTGKEAATASFLFSRAVFGLARLCGFASTLLIVTVLGIVTYAITQRYLFGTPLLWGDELNGYLLVALIMFGAAEALRRGDHIAIDLVSANVPPRLSHYLAIWGNLAVVLFSAVLAWSAWHSAAFSYDFGSYSAGYLEVAMWVPMVPVLIGAVLLALTALAGILEILAGGERQ